MAKKTKSNKEFSFEDALARLEEITHNLESGELSLDDSLSVYEEGIELRNLCNEYLEKAEKRLKVLQKKEVAAYSVKAASPDDDTDDESYDDDNEDEDDSLF